MAEIKADRTNGPLKAKPESQACLKKKSVLLGWEEGQFDEGMLISIRWAQKHPWCSVASTHRAEPKLDFKTIVFRLSPQLKSAKVCNIQTQT